MEGTKTIEGTKGDCSGAVASKCVCLIVMMPWASPPPSGGRADSRAIAWGHRWPFLAASTRVTGRAERVADRFVHRCPTSNRAPVYAAEFSVAPDRRKWCGEGRGTGSRRRSQCNRGQVGRVTHTDTYLRRFMAEGHGA